MTVAATTPASPTPASIVEPLPAGRPLVWWARALDAVSGIAVLLLISIVVFGGFRLRYGDLRITAQEVWRRTRHGRHGCGPACSPGGRRR